MPRYEVDIENKSVAIAEAVGWLNVKLDLAKKSWPDREFFGPASQSFMVEFKRPGERPTKKQARIHEDLRVLGHKVFVIDTVQDFRRLLERYRW